MAIVYRAAKGIPLTHSEVDNNFSELDVSRSLVTPRYIAPGGPGSISYCAPLRNGTMSTINATTTRIRLWPFVMPKSASVGTLSIFIISTNSSAYSYFYIYDSDAFGMPKDKIATADSLYMGYSGQNYLSLNAVTAMEGGKLYWIGLGGNPGGGSLRAALAPLGCVAYASSAGGAEIIAYGYYATVTNGSSSPASLTDQLTLASNTETSQWMPAIILM